MSLFVFLATKCISAYQYTLSPDHGFLRHLFPRGVCRYTPTCSDYAKDAINTYGVRGVLMAGRRLLRCHPGYPGGYDPIPSKAVDNQLKV